MEIGELSSVGGIAWCVASVRYIDRQANAARCSIVLLRCGDLHIILYKIIVHRSRINLQNIRLLNNKFSSTTLDVIVDFSPNLGYHNITAININAAHSKKKNPLIYYYINTNNDSNASIIVLLCKRKEKESKEKKTMLTICIIAASGLIWLFDRMLIVITIGIRQIRGRNSTNHNGKDK